MFDNITKQTLVEARNINTRVYVLEKNSRLNYDLNSPWFKTDISGDDDSSW
jgi:hypothetical protein